MQEPNDHELLAQFARENSEAAFSALVSRHVNLVYSVALRKTGNPQSAEEITQAAFIILARKAGSLSPRTILAGWLCETARLTAANYLRTEIRRQKREQEAHMQSLLNQPPPADDIWRQITPLLDDALAKLRGPDRDAVVLRFFENKNLRDVGAALGVSEDAAKRRVHRALEKLRKIFTRRGVTLSVAGLGAALANSVQAAPAGLGAAAAATAVQGTAISATLTTLVKGTMKTMMWMKLKFAAGIGLTALLAGGVAAVAISQSSGGNPSPQEIAGQSRDAYAALSSYGDSGSITTEVAGQTMKRTFNVRLQRPNLYRIEWTNTVNAATPASSHGVAWSAGDGSFMTMALVGGDQGAEPTRYPDLPTALASATAVSGGLTAIVPAKFFNQDWTDLLQLPSRSPLTRGPDEKAGGVDCFVISATIDLATSTDKSKFPVNVEALKTVTTTLWIGREDHLIHQTRQLIDAGADAKPAITDAQITAMLEKMAQPATPQTVAAFRTNLEANVKALAGQKIVITQTHENIALNPPFTPADFAR